MRLRIHADRSIVPSGGAHVVMLYPFWGSNAEDPGDPNTGRFDRYREAGKAYFELSDLASADVVVFPCGWTPALAGEAERVVATAREAGKPAVVFVAGDEHRTVRDASLVLQTSLERSRRLPNEFALPAWSEDFVTAHLRGELPIRRKAPRPVVGFCGLAPERRGIRARLRAHDAHTSIRARALRILREHPAVDTNFVVRDRFLGGAIVGGVVDADAMRRVRSEYVRNMVESDYVICARGAGNFSYRLYETLSCGRIPVFVDTDSVLPLDFAADWRSHCVWVNQSELEDIGDRVAEFHDAIGDEEFVDLQRSCRRFWEEYVAPEGFFAHFHEHLAGLPHQ
ncbi:MAG: exostosin [Gaiellaceae bacterium]